MSIRWTPTALRDLESLHEYISADNPQAAIDAVDEIVTLVDRLRNHPEMGRKGRVAGTRELIVAPYIIAYRMKRNVIDIIAIIHGARRWPDSF